MSRPRRRLWCVGRLRGPVARIVVWRASCPRWSASPFGSGVVQ